MKKVEIEKLRKIIEEERPKNENMLFKDIFSLSCYLSLKGEDKASSKLCKELFLALGENGRKTYFDSIANTMKGNEQRYQSEICAHAEMNKLFHGVEVEKYGEA